MINDVGGFERARIQPALLVALPVLVTGIAGLFVKETQVWGVVALLAGLGALRLVSTLVRERGQRVQAVLWESWGGPPTTLLLEGKGGEPAEIVQRRRERANQLGPAFGLGDDLVTRTRQSIEAYVTCIRERMRDPSQFPRVVDENVGYSFRRNVFAIRRWGVAVGAAATAVAASLFGAAVTQGPIAHAEWLGGATLFDLAAVVVWWSCVTGNWVRSQAFNYARALLDAAESGQFERNG